MPKVNITPPAVLLTSGQSVTFEATNENSDPVAVKWSLTPAIGSFAAPPDPQKDSAPSATYVASTIAAPQTVTVIAVNPKDDNNSGSATISLTTDAISILPAKVDLKAQQSQQFVPMIAGIATPPVAPGTTPGGKWTLSPKIGQLSQEGLYTAPDQIPDAMTVTVMLTSDTNGKQGTATVNLQSPPWTGRGVQFLGGFLLLVFTLVFLMILLWPPALPSPDTARANRIEAEKTLDLRNAALETAEKNLATAKKAFAVAEASEKRRVAGTIQNQATAATSGAKPAENVVTPEEAKTEVDVATYARDRADEAREFADRDLRQKREDERLVNDPGVDTKLLGHINRELDLLSLVLLAGSLGAFLHMAQSFSDYIGNRTIKSQWAWWYYFRPFIGAGLALVVYAAVRGGFMAIATGSSAKASELNPFGLVGVAAMVGMFSRAATMKLGEVFDTLFKTEQAKESKDKLVPSTQAAAKSNGQSRTGTAAATTTK